MKMKDPLDSVTNRYKFIRVRLAATLPYNINTVRRTFRIAIIKMRSYFLSSCLFLTEKPLNKMSHCDVSFGTYCSRSLPFLI